MRFLRFVYFKDSTYTAQISRTNEGTSYIVLKFYVMNSSPITRENDKLFSLPFLNCTFSMKKLVVLKSGSIRR